MAERWVALDAWLAKVEQVLCGHEEAATAAAPFVVTTGTTVTPSKSR